VRANESRTAVAQYQDVSIFNKNHLARTGTSLLHNACNQALAPTCEYYLVYFDTHDRTGQEYLLPL
jgi:hypothetical protein